MEPSCPTSEPDTGGTRVTVTVTGTNFLTGATVNFGTVPATKVTLTSPTSLTTASPFGTGMFDVTVITTGGTSIPTTVDKFTYLVAPPPAGNNDLSVQLSSPLFAARAPSVTVTVTNHRSYGGWADKDHRAALRG